MVPLLLAATLITQSPLAVQTLQVEGGPSVRVHRQEGPLVALRLSVPVPADLPEGAVELLQELARPSIDATARRFGAVYQLRHDPGRAVVAVSGPAGAFDAMVAILRRATGEPDLAVAALRRARARAEDRVLARLEQPGPRVRRLLEHGLYGGPFPRAAAATSLEPEAIRRLRARIFAPDRVRVVFVGAVPEPVLRSAFTGWPAPGSDDGAAFTVDSTATPAQPQIHREWGGIAYRVTADPAVLEVAAELVERRVRVSSLRYGDAEVWLEPGPALALIGAATPGDTVVQASAGISDLPVQDDQAIPPTDVRRYLRRMVAEAAALVGPDAVREARTSVRRQLLLEARTAAGKAEVIGRLADGLGPDVDPDAYMRRLEEVDLADVRALLTRILDTPAVVAEAK